MLTNRDVSAAWRYHDGTKHSVASLRAHRHSLDWEIKPRPFKIYSTLEAIPLLRELPASRGPALAAMATHATSNSKDEWYPNRTTLSRLLHFPDGGGEGAEEQSNHR